MESCARKLGAQVAAIDNSESGLANARKLCTAYPDFSARRNGLLEPLPFGRSFDLV